MTKINLFELPTKLQKKHPHSHVASLIARLAVDKRYQKKGLGSLLLIDALKKLLIASEIVAFPIVVVDAKDGLSQFYKKFGFDEFRDDRQRLFITMTNIRTLFGKI